MYTIAMKNDFVNINLRISASDYGLLKTCGRDTGLSTSQIIRMAIQRYLNNSSVQPELKPQENLHNPVMVEKERKRSLEIPVSDPSDVIESASLTHKLERKFKPAAFDIIKARRARDAGRDYDKSMEAFFDDING